MTGRPGLSFSGNCLVPNERRLPPNVVREIRTSWEVVKREAKINESVSKYRKL